MAVWGPLAATRKHSLAIDSHYETVNSLYIKRNIFSKDLPPPSRPILFNDDGTMTISITSPDGVSIVPGKRELAHRIIMENPSCLLNICIHWDFAVHPSILMEHIKTLYTQSHRWLSLRINAHLFAYILSQKSSEIYRRGPATSLRVLTIDDLADAADAGSIAAINKFLDQTFRSVPYQSFRQLELSSYYRLPSTVSLWSPQMQQFPFAYVRNLAITNPIPAIEVYDLVRHSGGKFEELYVSELMGPGPSRGNDAPVEMPNLLVLSLFVGEKPFNDGETGWAFSLLRKFSCPRIIELALGYENVWNTKAFTEFISISPTACESLNILRLEKMSLQPHHFIDLLQQTGPRLLELAMDCQQDHYKGGPTPTAFNQETCSMIMNCNYLPFLTALAVREQCIEKSGAFGQLIRFLDTRALLDLMILGENAKAKLHPADRKAFKSCGRVAIQFPGDCL